MNKVLVINKEQGWTSHDVVAKLRGILKIKKIGHAGTLDPMATGVLLILVGQATKLSDSLMNLKKTYYGEVTLGANSDTYDAEGKITKVEKAADLACPEQGRRVPALEEVKSALQSFVGEIEQVPPVYSAKKIKGKKAYELARAGQEVKLEAKQVTIYEITDIEYDYPIVKFRTKCSKGTYIRSLAYDLGQKLGTGGYLSALVRESVGDYSLQDAVKVGEVENG